jgi:hypothetical protein
MKEEQALAIDVVLRERETKRRKLVAEYDAFESISYAQEAAADTNDESAAAGTMLVRGLTFDMSGGPKGASGLGTSARWRG